MKNAGLGDRIKALRGAESRPVFAKRFSVSIDTVVRYENEQTFPGADFVQTLCNHYKVSADWLLFGDATGGENTPHKNTPEPLVTTPAEIKNSYNYNKMTKAKVLELAPTEFEALWDWFRKETAARRGWLQIEIIARFPEFLEWLESQPEPLIPPPPPVALTPTELARHYGLIAPKKDA